MTDIIDIKKLKNISDLRSYATDLFVRLEKALEKNEVLTTKIRHLEDMLVASPKFDIISPEQLTCEMEIRRIEEAAKTRPLSMEEAKIFDIMNKNLISIKKAKREEKAPPIEISGTVGDLLQIVSNGEDK